MSIKNGLDPRCVVNQASQPRVETSCCKTRQTLPNPPDTNIIFLRCRKGCKPRKGRDYTKEADWVNNINSLRFCDGQYVSRYLHNLLFRWGLGAQTAGILH